MGKMIEMDCYEASGVLADILNIITGTTFFFADVTTIEMPASFLYPSQLSFRGCCPRDSHRSHVPCVHSCVSNARRLAEKSSVVGIHAATGSRHPVSLAQAFIFDTAHKAGYVENGVHGQIPIIFMLPQQLKDLVQFVPKLSSNQRVVVFWNKHILEKTSKIRLTLTRLGLVDVNSAYLLPNASSPSHLVMTEGDAIGAFYRARAGQFFLKRILYKMDVMKYFEKSLICWAKAN